MRRACETSSRPSSPPREETAAVRAAADAALAQEREVAREADDEVAERLLLEVSYRLERGPGNTDRSRLLTTGVTAETPAEAFAAERASSADALAAVRGEALEAADALAAERARAADAASAEADAASAADALASACSEARETAHALAAERASAADAARAADDAAAQLSRAAEGGARGQGGG